MPVIAHSIEEKATPEQTLGSDEHDDVQCIQLSCSTLQSYEIKVCNVWLHVHVPSFVELEMQRAA